MAPDGAPRLRFLGASERAAAGELWRAAEGTPGARGLTCGWDWVDAWLSQFGDVVPHRFAIGLSDGAPVAAALIAESRTSLRDGLWARTLHLGTAGEGDGKGIFVERNRVLAHGVAERRAFVAALLAELSDQGGWDELRLPGFRAADAADFAALAPELRLVGVPSPVMDLAAIRADGGDVVAALRSGPRSRIRRSLRGFGDVETEWASDVDGALAIFDELVELHQRHWQAAGEPGAFAVERVVGFHRELIRRLTPRDAALLFRARAGDTTIGTVYGMRDGDRLLFYQSGIARFDDPKLKPGLVTHTLCMQACLERGYDRYDFLAGEDRYKRELTDASDELVWGRLLRPRSRAALADRLRRRLGRAPLPITPFE